MLTLITGVPGAGKTLNTLKTVETEWGKSDRPIYYRGIKELSLPWTELSDEQIKKWYDLPAGSIIVVDEAQQVWPNRPANKPCPESVSRMDTHRHQGIDFYVITQKPTLVDFQLRAFVGRHFHFERGYNREGTRRLEWQKSVDQTGDYHERQEAQVSRVKFDKAYYEKYKSAEVHTHKPRIPKKFWYFVAALFFTGAAGVYAYTSISARQEPGFVQGQDFRPDQYGPIGTTPVPRGSPDAPLTESEYIDRWKPRVRDMPFSAPMYDEVTEVKTYPRPQCMLNERTKECQCYTQQASPLDISYQTCITIVRRGWFNPFMDESTDNQRPARGGGQAMPPPPADEQQQQQQARIIYGTDSGMPGADTRRPLTQSFSASNMPTKSQYNM